MNIDIRTLVFVIGIVQVIQILVFIHQFRITNFNKCIRWWLLWSISEFIAFGFMLLRDITGFLNAVIIVQNFATLAGTTFLYIGIKHFLNKPINYKLLFSIYVVFAIGFLYYLFIDNNINIRTILISVSLAIVAFLTAYALIFDRTKSIQNIANFNASIFIAHGILFSARFFFILFGVDVNDIFNPAMINSIPFLDALIMNLLWAFGLIMMLNQKLNITLKESKNELKQIFNTSPDCVSITRYADGLFIDINEVFTTITGYTRDETIGRSSLEINIWNDNTDRQKVVNLLEQQGFCDNYEAKFKLKDGSLITGLMSAKILTINDVPHMVSITRDISKRKNSELLLKQKNEEYEAINEELKQTNFELGLAKEKSEASEKKLQEQVSLFELVFQNTIDSIVILDKDYNFIKVSNSYAVSCQKEIHEFQGKNHFEMFPSTLKDEFDECKAKKEIYRKTARPFVFPGCEEWGTTYWNLGLVPILDDNQEIKLFIFTLKDVTNEIIAKQELVSAKVKAEESERLKSAFLANMSHEIRTPLNSIVGFSKMIAEKENLDLETKSKMAEVINFNSNVLMKIIDDIIDLSKIEAGIININQDSININHLLSNIYEGTDLLKKHFNRENIEIIYVKNQHPHNIVSDKLRLAQIFNNLLSNALKYTEIGTVEFGYEITDSNKIQFFIKDSGVGISDDDKTKIFSRFYKANNEFKTFRGIGLGLSITKQIIEKMGGEIWFNSIENKGTVFYFTLPYIKSKEGKIEEIVISNSFDLKGKNILIAEDDDGNFMLAKMMLNDEGAIVNRVVNGQEAVTYCKDNSEVDLVLMDMKMPVMDGLEATKLIKQFRKDLIIISLSAHVIEDAQQASLKAGCDFCLSKPIQKEILIDTLKMIIDNYN